MDYIQINKKDNVIVALRDLPGGYAANLGRKKITVTTDVKKGHKIAVTRISSGDDIVKYGQPIGHATRTIQTGEHVHTHNLQTNLTGLLEYKYEQKKEDFFIDVPEKKIMAYKRKNGDTGIRNELWIIPTVGCVNGICDIIRDQFIRETGSLLIDGVYVFPHNYGCSQSGDDLINTRTILQGMIKHPNAGGVLAVGLGCECNQLEVCMESLTGYDPERVKTIVAQDVEDEIEQGVALLKLLYDTMKDDSREEVRISCLTIGLECGGSDFLSGITANPLLGELSNYMIQYHGTTLLTEVPEMFGAETFLMERAIDEVVFHKIVDLINDFKKYYIDHGQKIYENPSPGNKQGGITTLEEKSLGAVKKSGKAPVIDVLKYGEIVRKKGLNLLSAPGSDLVATTALAVSGCQLIIFTTGRGTPFGGPVPTLKVSTNSQLFYRKRHWIDFNAGTLIEDREPGCVLKDFINLIVDTANGKKTKNEINGFRNMTIFKSGVIL